MAIRSVQIKFLEELSLNNIATLLSSIRNNLADQIVWMKNIHHKKFLEIMEGSD